MNLITLLIHKFLLQRHVLQNALTRNCLKLVRVKGTKEKEKNLSQDSFGLFVSYSLWHSVFQSVLLFESQCNFFGS